jgi:hypothetical protein
VPSASQRTQKTEEREWRQPMTCTERKTPSIGTGNRRTE